jgi:hypothetical protein
MEEAMADRQIMIELSQDEALVLFEWLSRNENQLEGMFQDHAEQRVLRDVEAALERTLVEPFKPNYDELVAQARQRVCNKE